MRRLQNSVHRLSSIVQKEDVHEKKEVTKEHEHKKDDKDEDDERKGHREKSKRK